jgi:hypothetical protein
MRDASATRSASVTSLLNAQASSRQRANCSAGARPVAATATTAGAGCPAPLMLTSCQHLAGRHEDDDLDFGGSERA